VDYDTLGPYTIHECLGIGGMATVHRATVDHGGVLRELAIKRLLPQIADDQQFVAAFIREARLAAQLHHPNIAQIYELGHADGVHFIAMELVRGVPLGKLMNKAAGNPAPIGVMLAIVLELCAALDYARSEPFSIIHRDVTPSNVMISAHGRVKMVDFGVAKAMSGAFTTNTGMVKGKLGYMPIEALAGEKLDHRADVFSVGVVAWELLTGKRLFYGLTDLEVIAKVREGRPPPPSSLNASCPRKLDDAILQALARYRDDRWASAGELRNALEAVRRGLGVSATPQEVAAWHRDVLAGPFAPADTEITGAIRESPVVDVDDNQFTAHRAPVTVIDQPKFISSDTVVDRSAPPYGGADDRGSPVVGRSAPRRGED
jgi:serine/threonine protein kinase